MQPKLTNEIIKAAIEGFEAQKRRIDGEIVALKAMLSGGSVESALASKTPTTGKRKKFSAAVRRRMKEGQQRRWAKIRGESQPPAPATPEAPKAKRRISEEGMKRIIAATKKRFALKRAEAAKAERAATKTSAIKKTPARKAAVKIAPAKAAKKAAPAKKSAAKKSATRKPAQVPAQTVAEATN